MSERNERLELLGALLVKSVNRPEKLPEPLRGMISVANEAMTDEQGEAQYKLFAESGISGFTVGMYEDNDLGEALRKMTAIMLDDLRHGVEEAADTEDADDDAPSGDK